MNEFMKLLMVYDFLWFHIFLSQSHIEKKNAEKYLFDAINCKNNVRPNRNNVRIAGHTFRSLVFHLYYGFWGVKIWLRAPNYRYFF